MYVKTNQGTERLYVVEKVVEDIPGGAPVAKADFPSSVTFMPEGAVLGKDANGLYHVVKTTKTLANSTASAPRLPKLHPFKVGDVISDGDKGLTISAIDQSNAGYDVLTFSSGTLTTFAEGTFLYQVETEDTVGGGDAPATLYTPEGIAINSVDLSLDNLGCGVVVRGTVNESNMPYPVNATIKAALSLIRFK